MFAHKSNVISGVGIKFSSENAQVEVTKLHIYKIYVNPNNYKAMREDIWSDEHFPGTLLVGNNKYAINISYRGNSTRKHKKKSYNILFNKPFFLEKDHEIHLNAEYNDPSLIRNKLSLDFFNRIGVFAPRSKHIQLYINGCFLGIFLQLESFDSYLLEKGKKPDGSIYYATDNDANFSLFTSDNVLKLDLLQGYTKKYETNENDKENLLELLIKINTLTDMAFSEQIDKSINIDNYLRWLTGVVCTQNFDGFIQNYALYRNGDTGLFEIIPWDYDGTWGRDRHGRAYEHDYIPIEGYNTLTARLLKVPRFRHRYRYIMESVLQGQFTKMYQAPIIESLYNKLKPVINKDPFFKYTAEFEAEPNYILNFIDKRNKFLKNELLKLI